MKFIADLHIHSKYSRATAKNSDIENIYKAAQIKGIQLVGTGDFTHPDWFLEIQEKLEPADNGLFKLKKEIEDTIKDDIPGPCRDDVRFILVTEISNIYKKEGRTRKNHNLVFMPGIEEAAEFRRRLDKIGNINSDGRPILGLDARDLLEISLEVADKSFLVPAHIWTPWFSVLGSKSGFDSIEECFGDLSSHIFALETGLSSDPAMNWRVSSLDKYALISNSDAHSPMKLGREANLFDTDLDYYSVLNALKENNNKTFTGTIEFYPEEGKYHYDGHRKCNICFKPEETKKYNGVCPVCEKPLTIGVLNRVYELSDREEGYLLEDAPSYESLIPIDEILSEVLKVGPKTKKVMAAHEKIVTTLGSEFSVLKDVPIEDIEKIGVPLFAEAISRMRKDRVLFSPGYDGEYGKVKLFTEEERKKLTPQKTLFKNSQQKENNGFTEKKVIKKKAKPKTEKPEIKIKTLKRPKKKNNQKQ